MMLLLLRSFTGLIVRFALIRKAQGELLQLPVQIVPFMRSSFSVPAVVTYIFTCVSLYYCYDYDYYCHDRSTVITKYRSGRTRHSLNRSREWFFQVIDMEHFYPKHVNFEISRSKY